MPDNLLPFIKPQEVEAEIRRLARDSSIDVIILDHARMRMLEREITDRQIFNVLKNGDLIDGAKWDAEKERGWKCKFRRVTAGVEVTVVAKLIKRESATCLIVTVF